MGTGRTQDLQVSTDGFSRHSETPDGDRVVRLQGELDLESARPARDELVGALEAGRRVIVDLTAVGFMDSSGLGTLVFALREAKAIGGTLTVANPQPWVRKLFEAAGVAELFGLGHSHEHGSVEPRTATSASNDDTLAEVCTLLHGYENLLRWGDLTPEQVTIALGGHDLAEPSDDLALAQRVRAALADLGEILPVSSDDAD